MLLLIRLAACSALQPQPAAKCVALTPYLVNEKRFEFEQRFADEAAILGKEASAFLMLRRRNDVTMYGKVHSEYSASTPTHMALQLFADATSANAAGDAVPLASGGDGAAQLVDHAPLLWDATLVQQPESGPAVEFEPNMPCFLAMKCTACPVTKRAASANNPSCALAHASRHVHVSLSCVSRRVATSLSSPSLWQPLPGACRLRAAL